MVEVEQRPNEHYTEENITRPDFVGLRAKVLDSEKIECIPIDELEVHRDDHADPADGNSRRPKATERPRSALWTEAG